MGRRRLLYGLSLFILWGIVFQSSAQDHAFHLVSPLHSYKIDLKVGGVSMLSDVPDKYLDKLNNVNIPIGVPGVSVFFVARKAFTGHFEFGYQLSYNGLYGDVKQHSNDYWVHTQALENSYLFCYNLRRTDYFRPLYNCFIFYKIGAITLKNDPRLRLPDGSLQSIPGVKSQKFFFSNGVALVTGLGVGINHQITPNFGVVGTFEFSRSSDSAADNFKIDKIFYNSPNTVNKCMSLAFGVSYTFDLMKPKDKSSEFYKARSETKKRLLSAKIKRQKRRWAKKSQNIWKS